MLEVQKFLIDGGIVDDLAQQFGINAAKHDVLPLVILNYDQIESPKTHPIVRECRALVLNTNDWSLVARSFSRFFNWGEVADEMALFDFSDLIVQEKVDGSLVVIYHFDGKWMANTRGSFAMHPMEFQNFTWRDGFCQAIGIKDLQELDDRLDKNISYICEFCSLWNKIVRRYDKPLMYLLTAFRGEDELTHKELRSREIPGFVTPNEYRLTSVEQIKEFLDQQASSDPTFEGVVGRDKKNQRYKFKNSTYLALHRLRGEGDNLYNPKHLIPFVLAGEGDELQTYFPEVKEKYEEVKAKCDHHLEQILALWRDTRTIKEQKDFALSIIGKTPFTGILFQARKLGETQTEADVKKIWRQSGQMILKVLFDK